jgi:hypothetical protein
VVDYAVKVRVSNGAVDLANVKQSMNPFCEVRWLWLRRRPFILWVGWGLGVAWRGLAVAK